MRVLAIDTHGPVGGIAVVSKGRLLVQVMHSVLATHSEQLMPALQQALLAVGEPGDGPPSRTGVGGIAVAIGPGSYTGLRIGVTTAKTLAYAWGVPLVGIGTLEAMAFQAAGVASLQGALISARRGRVYAALYRQPAAGARPVRPVAVLEPDIYRFEAFLDALVAVGEPCTLVGDGVDEFAKPLAAALADRWVRPLSLWERLHPASLGLLGEQLLQAGQADDPAALVPEYLRKSEAELRWESRSNS